MFVIHKTWLFFLNFIFRSASFFSWRKKKGFSRHVKTRKGVITWLRDTTRAMFLSKDVDVVITDKITGHCKHLNSLKGTAYMKRSGQLLLLANAAPQSGSSSVLHVASK